MTSPSAGLTGRTAVGFAVVGGVSTVLYFILALCGSAVGLPAFLSSLAAYAATAPVSFFGHRYLTFRSRAPLGETAPRFAAVALVQYLIALALPAALSDYAGLPPVIAYACVCVVVPVFSLFVMARCVFRPATAA